jgi:hypothetical protein
MIDILPQSDKGTLAMVISGKLTDLDYQKIEPELDLRADQMDAFDLLVELDDIRGLEPEAVRDNLSFTAEYAGSIRRMAVVTEEPLWQGLLTFVGKPLGELLDVNVERFDDSTAAWEWLRS